MGIGGRSGRMEGNEQKWKEERVTLLQELEENGGAGEQEKERESRIPRGSNTHEALK